MKDNYMTALLLHITTASEHYAAAEALLTEAFPADERRPAWQQRLYTDSNPLFQSNAIMHNGTFAGLITLWHFDEFIYVEHFATLPSLRGQGIGAKVLSELHSSAALPIVLEVERPDNTEAQRRIEFYKRNGFSLWSDTDYIQPPYQPGLNSVPMHIMACGNGLAEGKHFDMVKQTLYRHVYNAL